MLSSSNKNAQLMQLILGASHNVISQESSWRHAVAGRLWSCHELRTEMHDPRNGYTITSSIGTAIAVPADVPDGTIIWESEDIVAKVRCENDQWTSMRESIYLWTDPAKLSSIGKGVRIGIRFKNTLYRTAATINTGEMSCTQFACNDSWIINFDLKFFVIVEKFGSVPEDGQVSTLAKYRVFQVDGRGGLADQNLNYIITGLTNIRFIPCSPDLTITPSVVNFPRAYAGTAENGKVASTAKFTLGLNKNCDTPFTVDAKFTPAAGNVISELLVPPNNSSVGIRLSRADNNMALPFSKWFKLADLDRRQPESIDFNADLIWRAAPVTGPFEAAVVVDMMYK
jgi:hypothetical protein